MSRWQAAALGIVLWSAVHGRAQEPAQDTCLVLTASAGRSTTADAGPNPDSPAPPRVHASHTFFDGRIDIRRNDTLTYEVFFPEGVAPAAGGLEVRLTEENLPDLQFREQSIMAREEARLREQPGGAWIQRDINLSDYAGRTLTGLNVWCRLDVGHTLALAIDNVVLKRASREHVPVYANGAPPVDRPDYARGAGATLLGPAARGGLVDRAAAAELSGRLADRVAAHEAELRQQESKRHAELVDRLRAEPGPAGLPHGHVVPAVVADPRQARAWPQEREAWVQSARTAIEQMDRDPAFTYAMGEAGVYAAIEEAEPALFERIRQRVEDGRLDVVGGAWVEFDQTAVGGESMLRQFEHGQAYFQRKFGRTATVGWAPATLAHAPTLPGVLKRSGIDSYYLAYGGGQDWAFHWVGLDGSIVVCVNEGATTAWHGDPFSRALAYEFLDAPKRPLRADLLWVVGPRPDAGDLWSYLGPALADWQAARELPAATLTTATDYFRETSLQLSSDMPRHAGELLSVYRGAYASRAEVKRRNRAAEEKLLTAEAAAALASLHGLAYPAAELETAWKAVLRNQRQGLLAGAADDAAYELARVEQTAAIDTGRWVTDAALRHLVAGVPDKGAGEGVLVFNPLGWARGGLVAVLVRRETKPEARFRVTRSDGAEVASQLVRLREGRRLVFWVTDVPAFGWDTYRIEEAGTWQPGILRQNAPGLDNVICRSEEEGVRLENGWVRVMIDKTTGQLASIFDKSRGREVLEGGRYGNVLEAHLEHPRGHGPLTLGPVDDVQVLVDRRDTTLTDLGPLVGRVRITWYYNQSRIMQTVTLTAGSPRIDFETSLVWAERDDGTRAAPTLRTAFPLSAAGAGQARYSVPLGHVERPADGAEVPGQAWAAVAGPEGGAVVLSEGGAGFSASPDGVLRMTLRRTTDRPDPYAPWEPEEFTYSLIPVGADEPPAAWTRWSMEAGRPLLGVRLTAEPREGDSHPLPGRFELVHCEGTGVVVTSLRPAPDGNGLLMRLVNEAASATSIHVDAAEGLLAQATDSAEQSGTVDHGEAHDAPGHVDITLGPFGIGAVRLSPAAE